jgi:hypothetical protein
MESAGHEVGEVAWLVFQLEPPLGTEWAELAVDEAYASASRLGPLEKMSISLEELAIEMGKELAGHEVDEVALLVFQLEPQLGTEWAGHAAGEVCASASLLGPLEKMSISLEELGI